MGRLTKFKVGEHVYVNNELMEVNGKLCIIIGYDATYCPDEMSYRVHFPDGEFESTMKESHLVAYEEPKNENHINISFDISKILSEETIIELAKEAIDRHVKKKCDDGIFNRAAGHSHGIIDEIIISVGKQYADDMFKDEILKQKFEEQIKGILECEINRETPINENYDLFRQQMEWKLQSFGEQYIKEHHELIIEFMLDGLKEAAEKVAKHNLNSIIQKTVEFILNTDVKTGEDKE